MGKGDTSGEIKGLIIVITFLSTFFIITAMIPPQFLYSGVEGRTVETPEYFESVDIYSFAETYNFTVKKEDYFTESFSLGGWNVRFYCKYNDKRMYVNIYDSWWILEWNFRSLDWYDMNGVKVSEPAPSPYTYHFLSFENLDKNYDNKTKTCRFTVKNHEVTFVVYFGFNTTKYSKPTEALENSDLRCLFCINFDKINTTFNAWNLIGAILFFQMPDVHPAINALIAIPLWILIAYLIYVLILKAIPFVGG